MAKDEADAGAQPIKQATTNTVKGSKVEVEAEHPPLLFFRPETGEFVAVPANERNKLISEVGKWNSAIATLHAANEQVQYLEDHIAKLSLIPTPLPPGALEEAKQAWDLALNWQRSVADFCRANIDSLDKIGSSGKELVELIPIPGSPVNKKKAELKFEDLKLSYEPKGTIGVPWKGKAKEFISKDFIRPPMGSLAYVPSDQIKSHWPTFKDPTKWKDVVQRDPNTGKKTINKAKLQSYAYGGLKSIKVDSADFKKLEKNVTGALGSWATAWNEDTANQFNRKGEAVVGPIKGDVELDAAAQFLRYFCGASLKGTFQPLNRNVAIKFEGSAEFAVAEAKATGKFYYPRKDGWMWTLPAALTDKGAAAKDIDLGAVRMMLTLELKGTVGASIAAEASLSIEQKTGQMPIARGSGSNGGPPPSSVPILGPEKKMLVAGGELGINAFAGVKASAELKGAIEWRNPENPEKEFAAFAAVAPAGSGMAGIGGSAKVSVQYADGKFKLHVDASACIGYGAEGKLTCEVNLKLIVNFVKWFFYQLYHANFKHLEFIEKSAFDAMRDLTFISISQCEDFENMFGMAKRSMERTVEQTKNALMHADARQKLARNILSDPSGLKYALPETKGMLIHQLCSDDGVDWAKSGFGIGNEFLRDQKEAIKYILQRWSHTRSDCNNVIQHMTANGAKGNYEANLARLRRFFREEAPFNRDLPLIDSKHGEDFDNWYIKLSAELKQEPTRGFPVMPSNSYQYAWQRDIGSDHPLFSSTGENAFYA